MTQSTDQIPHGTTGYANPYRCRCEVCRKANADACAKWLESRKSKIARLHCPRCGVAYTRCKKASRTDLCIDCRDTEAVTA